MERKTEKVTVNLNVVDIGYIDLLVDQGVYSNRTDFIKDATKSKLEDNNLIIEQIISKENKKSELIIGIAILNKDSLKVKGKNLVVIGMLVVPNSIEIDDLRDVYQSIKVYGITRSSAEIKEHFKL